MHYKLNKGEEKTLKLLAEHNRFFNSLQDYYVTHEYLTDKQYERFKHAEKTVWDLKKEEEKSLRDSIRLTLEEASIKDLIHAFREHQREISKVLNHQRRDLDTRFREHSKMLKYEMDCRLNQLESDVCSIGSDMGTHIRRIQDLEKDRDILFKKLEEIKELNPKYEYKLDSGFNLFGILKRHKKKEIIKRD